MKKLLLLLTCCLSLTGVRAQTFAEWFQQTKTQKKYLLAQIAALQAYIGFAKTGYNIAQKGLGTIGDIKNGDFNIHSLYLGSLKAVSPAISQYPRVADILALQQQTVETVTKSRNRAASSGTYTGGELAYIRSVYERLDQDCSRTLADLDAVTTPGKLEMKDDERLKRIDRLFADSQNQYRFAQSFSSGLSVMSVQKASDQREISNLKIINGIK